MPHRSHPTGWIGSTRSLGASVIADLSSTPDRASKGIPSGHRPHHDPHAGQHLGASKRHAASHGSKRGHAGGGGRGGGGGARLGGSKHNGYFMDGSGKLVKAAGTFHAGHRATRKHGYLPPYIQTAYGKIAIAYDANGDPVIDSGWNPYATSHVDGTGRLLPGPGPGPGADNAYGVPASGAAAGGFGNGHRGHRNNSVGAPPVAGLHSGPDVPAPFAVAMGGGAVWGIGSYPPGTIAVSKASGRRHHTSNGHRSHQIKHGHLGHSTHTKRHTPHTATNHTVKTSHPHSARYA